MYNYHAPPRECNHTAQDFFDGSTGGASTPHFFDWSSRHQNGPSRVAALNGRQRRFCDAHVFGDLVEREAAQLA